MMPWSKSYSWKVAVGTLDRNHRQPFVGIRFLKNSFELMPDTLLRNPISVTEDLSNIFS